jgi:membrane-associated phospholipid phosphatase
MGNTFSRTILLIFIYCNVAGAQQLPIDKPADSATTWEILKYDGRSTIDGLGHAFTRPFYWKKKDFTKLGVMVIGSFALSSIDDEANTFFERQESAVPEVIQDFGWYFGSPQNFFMTTAGIYGYGLLSKNEKVRKTGVLIVASSITSGLLQSIGKTVIGRARPSEGLGSGSFDFFSNKPGFHSFPSGHAILSITMAHAIAKQFNGLGSKIVIYSLGSIAPLSRLLNGAHWLTDITFSAALSIMVVDSIDKFLFEFRRYDYPKKEKLISWNFTLSPNRIGLIGTF